MKKWILISTVFLSVVLFLAENVFGGELDSVWRRGIGEGKKTEQLEVYIEGEKGKKTVEVEIGEREYTREETMDMFQRLLSELDEIVLGQNESFDKVQYNLNFPVVLDEYPVLIEWELDSYTVLNIYGEIQEEHLTEEGCLVGIKGKINYGQEEVLYSQYANVIMPQLEGGEKLLYDIKQKLRRKEETTREKESFSLPSAINGKQLTWKMKKQNSWFYVLIAGVGLCGYLIYREKEREKKQILRRREELLREYPGLVSKLTMLLEAGITLKAAWEKIVQNYESQKAVLGTRLLYEEMASSCREMQSGVSEVEAYERFGKRCQSAVYMKFGTLLSQNLRKGSQGLSELLKVEAIQSFENRKSTAKRLGEEAGTKLLVPMLGMLAVVFIIVMIPAFLSMKI